MLAVRNSPFAWKWWGSWINSWVLYLRFNITSLQ